MKIRIRLAAFLPLALLVLSCAHSAGVPAGAPEERLPDFYPLKVGNSWTYSGTFLGQQGEKRVTIVGEKDGYFRDDAGGMLAADSFGVRDQKRYLLKGPLKKGTQWTNVVSVSSTEHYEILDSGFTATTPAGSFPGCVSVLAKNRIDEHQTLINEMTFAPRVGIIRIKTAASVDGKTIPAATLELKSYSLK